MVGSLPALAFFQLLMKTELEKGEEDVDRPRAIMERTYGAERRGWASESREALKKRQRTRSHRGNKE